MNALHQSRWPNVTWTSGNAPNHDGYQPLVTVIIPVKDRQAELALSIQSAILQSYQSIEIIVVDDGSSEPSKISDVCESFNDPRIGLVRHDASRGGGAARNSGIKCARGRFIAFLDSDDIWDTQKIGLQVDAALSAPQPDHCLVYCQSTVVTDGKTTIAPTKALEDPAFLWNYLFEDGGFIPTPSIFVARCLAAACLFDETLPRHQDYDFLSKVTSLRPALIMINKALLTVEWRGNNVSHKGWTPEVSRAFLEKHSASMGRRISTLFALKFIATNCAIYGRKLRAISEYLKIIRTCPVSIVVWPMVHVRFWGRLMLDWRFA